MTRPRIWKDTTRKVLPWCATNPYKPGVHRLCATWREAVEYVTDALHSPFPMELDRGDKDELRATYYQGGVWLDDPQDGHVIVLEHNHWRPLARALTRLADLEGVK